MSSNCFSCGKKFDFLLWKITYTIVYNKCQGKTCPDCGKVRKLGNYETIYTEDSKFFNPCIKCKKVTGRWIDKLCSECFLEREEKRGCVCIWYKDYNESKGHHNNINYYCPLCDEAHPREALCKECFEKQIKHNENKKLFFRVILPSVAIGMIMGLFLGWLFFRKLWKIKKKRGS